MQIIPKKPIFRYISYWNSWRRILMMQDGWYLEVELTPVNLSLPESWQDLAEGKLYWYTETPGTPPNKNPLATELPIYYLDQMTKHLSLPDITRLLKDDLWSEIDFPWFLEYQEKHHEGGAIPLECVMCPPDPEDE